MGENIMGYPYDEPSSRFHTLKFGDKKYHWIRTVKGKTEATKIKNDWKKTGNLVRIVPSDIKGWYKIYAWYLK